MAIRQTISEKGRLYLRLQMADQVGPVRVQGLVGHFGSVESVLAASMSELQRVEGIGPVIAKEIVQSRKLDGEVENEVARAQDCDARILCLEDEEYPAALRHIPDAPICLYVRGDLQPADAVAVGIVGTRKCSHYGREQAGRFGELLAGAGFTIISGLARGVDGFAHSGALRANGRTIAVLGNGLGTIYPPEHEELAYQISERGAILSELPIDAAPEAKNFPGRNRIIAGLALGVLVIEAGKKSGALITARFANEYNREAFALPGNIDRPDFCAGSNSLIREGAAKLVTCLEDILDELGDVGRIMGTGGSKTEPANAKIEKPPGAQPFEIAQPSSPAPVASREPGCDGSAMDAAARPRLGAQQQRVYEAIAAGAADLDAVCESTGIAAGTVAATVTQLQLMGLLSRGPGAQLQLRTRGAAQTLA